MFGAHWEFEGTGERDNQERNPQESSVYFHKFDFNGG